MNTLADLPTQGQFVSTALLADGALAVRFTPESVLEADAAAYVLRAFEPVNGEGTLRTVELLREAGEYVYVVAKEGAVALVGEGGEEVFIHATRFAGERTELNAKEFREALAFNIKLYENAHAAGRKTERKLERIRELLYEQARRISVKAERHESTSSVGVLYSQHAQFIERLLRETEV